MKTFKKVIAFALAMAMVAAVSVGATVAYLQDEDSDVNVMTLGNVKIEQHEYQRADGVAHNAGEAGAGNGVKEGALVPYVQGQPLYPAVPTAGAVNPYTAEATDLFFWGDYVYSGTAANGLWNDDKLSNVMDKMVFVENTGKSDAYYRTIIAFECPEGMEYSQGADKEFMMNVSGSTLYKWETIGYATIDGVRYHVEEATYQNALKPGQTAHPSLLQVVMTHNATNEDMELLGDTYEILVKSQAVQTQGFADAKTALDTAFGEITTTNHPWSNTVLVQADDEAEFMTALASGKEIIVNTDIVAIDDAAFNGEGAEVTLAGVYGDAYGYLAFAPGKGNDTTVENLNVTGSGFVEVGHYGEGGGTYVVKNLTIEGLTATLCINNGGNNIAGAFTHYGTATLTDCVMTGTVAAQEGYTPYDAAFVNGTKTTINGGEYGKIYLAHQAHVTITDANVDEITSCAITTRNLGKLTIGAGAKIGTINLTPGGYTPALVIEDGAEIGEIIYNGTTYTVEQWKNR